jgi:hypothetical protein
MQKGLAMLSNAVTGQRAAPQVLLVSANFEHETHEEARRASHLTWILAASPMSAAIGCRH